MKFMMITNATKESEAGRPPDPRMMEAVVKLTEELTKSGVLVSTGGLHLDDGLAFQREAEGSSFAEIMGPVQDASGNVTDSEIRNLVETTRAAHHSSDSIEMVFAHRNSLRLR